MNDGHLENIRRWLASAEAARSAASDCRNASLGFTGRDPVLDDAANEASNAYWALESACANIRHYLRKRSD